MTRDKVQKRYNEDRRKELEHLRELCEARDRLLYFASFPEFLDQVIREERKKETPAERRKNQPFYDFLARALIST